MDGVVEFFRAFFDTRMLNPHGICLLWRPELIATHAVSDVVIGLAYFSIPLALGVFLYHRRDVRFGWAIWMFVLFIMLCGVTHFMMVWTLWNPDYGVEALIKAATATASLVTAIALWPLLPKAIAIPSAETLQSRIDERDRALVELKSAMATMMEMREHEARQKLLLNELNHRVKNTLATVQSIAHQTLANAEDPAAFKQTFQERLLALSKTHDLLVRAEWRGASFHQLARETLDHHALPYSVEGADVGLHPNYAVSLGLALNELATNSIKHGAWSAGGHVRLTTAIVEDDQGRWLQIEWSEHGGPATLQPARSGFGSRLLKRGVAAELGGRVTLDYPTSGLVCTIIAPLSDKMQLMGEPQTSAARGSVGGAS